MAKRAEEFGIDEGEPAGFCDEEEGEEEGCGGEEAGGVGW